MEREFEAGLKSGILSDPAWIRVNDEIVVTTRKETRKKILKTVVSLAFTAAAFCINPILTIVLGIYTLWNLLILIASGQRMPPSFLKDLYEEGLLCAGMIVKTQPLTIAVLAEMTAYEGAKERYGCFFLEVKRLPGMEGALYEKIPCSCMFQYMDGSYHSAFHPHPLCWGTPDRQQIQAALQTLERYLQEEGNDYWEVIKQIAGQFPNIKDQSIVQLDEEFHPIGLKHYMENKFKPFISEEKIGNYVKTEQSSRHLPEETPVMKEFNKLADLAAEHLVYDYISRPCEYGDYTFHKNPGFYTYIGDEDDFLRSEQKRKIAFLEGEVPLLGGEILITTKGGRRKKELIPWQEVNFSTRSNEGGEIEVMINGHHTAVIPCHFEEYAGHEIFGEADKAAVLELERQRIEDFLESIKEHWYIR